MSRVETPPNIKIDSQAIIAPHAPDLYEYQAVATGVATLDDVTEADLDHYHEHGFLVIWRAFGDDLIEGAQQGLSELIDRI